MTRPTIPDLANAAGVSVATVNRVLAGARNVRQPTQSLVQEAAERIGFYGLGAIQSRVAASRPKYRFGFLLHQGSRSFYRMLAQEIALAAKAFAEAEIDARIEFLDDLSPQNTAARMLEMGEKCDAVAVSGSFSVFECRDCKRKYCYLCRDSGGGKRCPDCNSTRYNEVGRVKP